MTFDVFGPGSGHVIFSDAIKRAAAWIVPVDRAGTLFEFELPAYERIPWPVTVEADPITRGLGRIPACLAGPKADTRRSCPAQTAEAFDRGFFGDNFDTWKPLGWVGLQSLREAHHED